MKWLAAPGAWSRVTSRWHHNQASRVRGKREWRFPRRGERICETIRYLDKIEAWLGTMCVWCWERLDSLMGGLQMFCLDVQWRMLLPLHSQSRYNTNKMNPSMQSTSTSKLIESYQSIYSSVFSQKEYLGILVDISWKNSPMITATSS